MKLQGVMKMTPSFARICYRLSNLQKMAAAGWYGFVVLRRLAEESVAGAVHASEGVYA
jgi:hypothetical protein